LKSKLVGFSEVVL